jgi:hypothetical protein
MMKHNVWRKKPRDFVHVDELWKADACWTDYFFEQKVWVYVDEYRAELIGDEDYSRIIIHSGEDKAGQDQGWLFSRPLEQKNIVHEVLKKIRTPVSEQQLEALGFVGWKGDYI